MTDQIQNQPELPLIHVVGAIIRRANAPMFASDDSFSPDSAPSKVSEASPTDHHHPVHLSDAEVLVGQRPLTKSCGGQWEFIGGKIEPGETPSEALARECMEEASLKIEDAQVVAETTHRYPNRIVHLILMACRCAEGSVPVALEHLELRWVKPSQMHAMDFCSADVELIHTLFG